MKKILSWILMLCLVLGLVPAMGEAPEAFTLRVWSPSEDQNPDEHPVRRIQRCASRMGYHL